MRHSLLDMLAGPTRDTAAARRPAAALALARFGRGAAPVLEPMPVNAGKPLPSTVFRVTGPDGVLAYVKCSHGRDARARMQKEVDMLRSAAGRLAGHPGCAVPEVLAHDRRRAMMLLSVLPGRPLREILRAAIADGARTDLLRRTGRLLAAFHRPRQGRAPGHQPPPGLLAGYRARAGASPLLAPLCDRIESLPRAAEDGIVHRGRLHGDMNCNNLLAGPGRAVGLLDFEFSRTGPVVDEIAHFLVRVSRLAERPGAVAGQVVHSADIAAFADGYAAVAPEAARGLHGARFETGCLLALARALDQAAPASGASGTHCLRDERRRLEGLCARALG